MSSFNLENASLILNTFDSTMRDENTVNIWSNVNLRTLLGTMYDRYETFNLVLSQVITSPTALDIGGVDGLAERLLLIKVSGLQFTNQTYSVSKGILTNEAVIGAMSLGNDTTVDVELYSFGSTAVATFRASEMVNITIKLTRLNNATPNPTNDFPEMVFIFNIYGVEPKTKLIDNRMK
jgi:hypothetical protein